MTGPATCHPERPAVARGLCAACYQRAWRAVRPSGVPKRCRQCGVTYTARGWRYCSATCRIAAKYRPTADRRTRTLDCPTCGRTFAGQPGQRFCSLVCRRHRARVAA